jgi:glycosyltransferase involved in cell wall biosynthesis
VSYKLVSIIIPTKDMGNLLDKCLKSIFNNSMYPNYEVIVVDNGSTEENTAKLLLTGHKKNQIGLDVTT